MPPSAVSSEHIRGKQRRRREAILHAALRAFRDRGYHATTLEDIARRLDVRKTALYYWSEFSPRRGPSRRPGSGYAT